MRLLLFISCVLAISCGSSSKSKRIGDVGIVKKMCLAADTKENEKLMTEISVRNDEPALREMMLQGHVFIIPGQSKVIVRDVAFGIYQVDVTMNGEQLRLWVASEFIE